MMLAESDFILKSLDFDLMCSSVDLLKQKDELKALTKIYRVIF